MKLSKKKEGRMGMAMVGKGGRVGSGRSGEEGGKRGGNKREGGGERKEKGDIYSEAAHCRGAAAPLPPLMQTITPQPNLRRK